MPMNSLNFLIVFVFFNNFEQFFSIICFFTCISKCGNEDHLSVCCLFFVNMREIPKNTFKFCQNLFFLYFALYFCLLCLNLTAKINREWLKLRMNFKNLLDILFATYLAPPVFQYFGREEKKVCFGDFLVIMFLKKYSRILH